MLIGAGKQIASRIGFQQRLGLFYGSDYGG